MKQGKSFHPAERSSRGNPLPAADLLYEMLRGVPSDDPTRLYRRTREGAWFRRSGDLRFHAISRTVVIEQLHRFGNSDQ